VLASNDAWMASMQTASPAGLAAIKTGSNLRSALQTVASLQSAGEYWHIQVGALQVLWTRVLSPAHAQALLRKVSEHRVLYRRGQSTPISTVDESYTNLYDLQRQNGHWRVSLVSTVDDATARALAGAAPATAVPAATLQASATAAAAATATPVPSQAGGVPTATTSPSRASNDGVAVVSAFYAAVTARDYRTAYSLLSTALRAGQPEAQWAAQFAREKEARVVEAILQQQGPQTETIAVTLDTTWVTASGSQVQRRYAGTWRLRSEQGAWHLDAPALVRVTQ
jgi:hypothetical protein